MLVGSAPSCFDDPRVEVQYIDAFQWFIDNYPAGSSPLIDPFDVIIMDALDPQIQKDFVNALYDEGPFLKSIPNALNENGIFISQVGESVSMDDPAEKDTTNINRVRLVKSLSRLGFSSIRSYSDNAHSGFSYPWQFVTAFKNSHTKADWLANPSLVDLKIRKRSLVTVDGGSPFNFFDGATMQSFYYPTKPIEIVYCRDNPNSKNCKEGHGFDTNRQNVPISSLEVKQSSIGGKAGRGVFAKVDIPRESYVGLEKLIPSVEGDAQAYDLFLKTYEVTKGDWWASAMNTYIHGCGAIDSYNGNDGFVVDPTLQCFINHACDGNSNVGYELGVLSQATADPKTIPREIIEIYGERGVLYNPASDRQVQFYDRATPLRDIKQGEELLDNYLAHSGKSVGYWAANVAELRKECEGGAGVVREYEEYTEYA